MPEDQGQRVLKILEGVDLKPLPDPVQSCKVVSFLFLPHEHAQLLEVFSMARKVTPSDELHLMAEQDFHRLMTALGGLQKSSGVINSAAALGQVLDVFSRHQNALDAGGSGVPEQGTDADEVCAHP